MGDTGDTGGGQGSTRARNLYLAAVGIIVLYLAYLARTAVVPLLIALLSAYVLAPLVAALQRRRFSRIGAVTTLFVAFFGGVGLAAVFGLPPLIQEVRNLARAAMGEPARTVGMRLPGDLQIMVDSDPPVPFADLLKRRGEIPPEELSPEGAEETAEDRGNFERKMREVLEVRGEKEAQEFIRKHDTWLVGRHEGRVVIWNDRDDDGEFDAGYVFDGSMVGSPWVRDQFKNADIAGVVEDIGLDVFPDLSERFMLHTGELARGALGVVGTILGLLSWTLIIPLYTFYFLMRLEDVWNAFVAYLPGTHRDRVIKVLHRIHLMLIGFFRRRLLTRLFKGIMVAFWLAVLGAPYWAVFGALAGILTIVPAVGPLAAAIPAVILSYKEGGAMTAGLATSVLVASELIEGYILIPKMVGKEVGLHPMAVITSILVGGALLGVFGIVIAIPLAAASRIVWTEFVVPALRAKAAEAPPDDAPA
jgi:predicted PurR-regulated permease PerM